MTPAPLSRRAIGRGFRDLFGAAIASAALGVGFGAAAVENGLTPDVAIVMSALVFAGTSQFAALEVWADPMPWTALLLTTAAINGRHIVLGATLGDYLTGARRRQLALVAASLSDANWASTQLARANGERDLGHLIGGGLLLWLCWVGGTIVGAAGGDAIGDPRRFGVDVLIPVFLLAVLTGSASRRDLLPLIVAAAATIGLTWVIAPHWSVIGGALLGALVGTWCDGPR